MSNRHQLPMGSFGPRPLAPGGAPLAVPVPIVEAMAARAEGRPW